MGYLTLPSRFAILSLGLLALSGCGRSPDDSKQVTALWPPEESEVVLCPGDPRCGRQDSPDVLASTCRLHETRFKFKCGEQDLPCPGKGCPTGEPGLPDQKCWISETFVDLRCPSSPSPEAAPQAVPSAAEAPAAAPAPAEKPAE